MLNNIVDLQKYRDYNMNDPQRYRDYNLDVSKIKSIEDCAKVLQFLCKLNLEPTPIEYTYNGFDEVKEYFE